VWCRSSVQSKKETVKERREKRAETALFAELTTTRVTPDNARWVLELSQQLLLSTPDPQVVLQLIAAAELLAEDDLRAFHLARFQAAYPEEHARWVGRQAKKP
jgi:hypothetical protein